MNRQQREFYKQFSEHGSGDAKIAISPKEVLLILHIAYTDLYKEEYASLLEAFTLLAKQGFYHIPFKEIEALPEIEADLCFDIMTRCGVTDINNILYLYFKNLCDLYRRRFKYHIILKNQPFPGVNQIVPRSLLEYGNCSNCLLADWLQWRKWIFDIDNRSAQETGYIFEPILASCLGGEAVSASNSPVKRIDDYGNLTNNGRQIDCLIESEKEAYELKMRVTIAASGQGRFKEEMTFPIEAQNAGYTPILVVFDGTESLLLTKLKRQYTKCGGKYFIGEDAWKILSERAGREMSIFINKYIYPPINDIEQAMTSRLGKIQLELRDSQLTVNNGTDEYVINRN